MPQVTLVTTFNPLHEGYAQLLDGVKTKVLSTRIKLAKAACHEQIELYWWLGQQIVHTQELHGWGKSIVEQLANDLKKSFTDASFGFSPRNLWDMRRFYLEYRTLPNLRQVVAEIPWGQNLTILNKVKNEAAREYYLYATRDIGWTRKVLELQIESQSYERHRLQPKSHNFNKTLPAHLAEQAEQSLKSVYLLDTLGLTQPVLELQIENKMVEKIKDVMLEFGYGFAFMGNQYRIVSPSGTESYIDLLFSHRKLKCLVAIELKLGRFKPEYAGKMNYYLGLLDDFVKESWENPSIGIILCTSKDHVDVEYSLRDIHKPVGVAEYKLTKDLPNELSGKLPNPREIEIELLKGMGCDIDE